MCVKECVCVCVCTCMCVRACVYMYMCACVCVCVCVHLHVHAYMCVGVCGWVDVCAPMYVIYLRLQLSHTCIRVRAPSLSLPFLTHLPSLSLSLPRFLCRVVFQWRG
jgi:hypothetical protein